MKVGDPRRLLLLLLLPRGVLVVGLRLVQHEPAMLDLNDEDA